MKDRIRQKLLQVALRTALIYAVVGALWILLSDQALKALIADPETLHRIEVYKGWTFVFVTAVLLFLTLKTQLVRWEREVAARRKAEESARKSAERLQQAAHVGGVGTFEHDLQTDEIYLSPLLRETHGFPADAPIRLSAILDRVLPEDRVELDRAIAHIRQGGSDGRFSFECRVRIPQGNIRWMRATSQTYFEGEGSTRHAVRTVGALIDITDRKTAEIERQELESQLRQSQKMEAIGTLAGGVAHDFNNILTVIQGNASLMLNPDLKLSSKSDCARQIIRASERAAGLTRQLLMFSRKQVMQLTDLNLNEVVSNTTKMLRRILGEDVVFQANYAPNIGFIRGDAGMIEQILMNLVVNARDAMPRGGQLTVTTGAGTLTEREAQQQSDAVPGPHIWLSVTDTGTGIEPEVLPRIFEPFFTTKEVGKGTGLGLATVYGITRQHHGWVTVQSELNKGSTFRIHFPSVRSVGPRSDIVAPKLEFPRGTETILVVEDDPAVRSLMVGLLERGGYRVLQAKSGPVALDLWQAHRLDVDLLLTDIVMPEGISGIQLAEQLRQDQPALKVIYVSGYSAELPGSTLDIVEGINFLQKPFAPEKLARAIRMQLNPQPTAPDA